MSKKEILVMSVAGYPRFGQWDRVDNIMNDIEPGDAWHHRGHGRHQYFYNSEGYQLIYITNHSIPEGTDPYDIWSEIWDIETVHCDTLIEAQEKNRYEWVLPEPIEFTVDGQVYKYIGGIWGYSPDAESPEDDHYEE